MTAPFLPADWRQRAGEVCRMIEGFSTSLQTEAKRCRTLAGKVAGIDADWSAALDEWAKLSAQLSRGPTPDADGRLAAALDEMACQAIARAEMAEALLLHVAVIYRQLAGLQELAAPPAIEPDSYIQTVSAMLNTGVETAALVFSPSQMEEFRLTGDPTIVESVEFHWSNWLRALTGYLVQAHGAVVPLAGAGSGLREPLRELEGACRRISGGGEEERDDANHSHES